MSIEQDHLEALVTEFLRGEWFTVISFQDPDNPQRTDSIVVHGAQQSEADEVSQLARYLKKIDCPMDIQLQCIQSMRSRKHPIRDLL